MNKAQLVDQIAEMAGIPKTTAKKSIEAFIAVVSETLKNGDKVTLSGFGSFIVTQKPACKGRNFKTGDPIEIPAKSVIKFRPGIEPAEGV